MISDCRQVNRGVRLQNGNLHLKGLHILCQVLSGGRGKVGGNVSGSRVHQLDCILDSRLEILGIIQLIAELVDGRLALNFILIELVAQMDELVLVRVVSILVPTESVAITVLLDLGLIMDHIHRLLLGALEVTLAVLVRRIRHQQFVVSLGARIINSNSRNKFSVKKLLSK